MINQNPNVGPNVGPNIGSDAGASSDAERDTGREAKSYTTASIPSYYQLLGIKPNASPQEVRRAYRDLSKLYHPDTTRLESAIALLKFQALNEAYATLSSPEKRLTYDYKTGYSRISVMQPLSSQRPPEQKANGQDWSSSAYLDPTDRPLSAGEMFALFILGITFIGCLILVITISLTQGDISGLDLELLNNKDVISNPTNSTPVDRAENPLLDSVDLLFNSQRGNSQSDSPLNKLGSLELPQTPWLVSKMSATQPK